MIMRRELESAIKHATVERNRWKYTYDALFTRVMFPQELRSAEIILIALTRLLDSIPEGEDAI